MTNHACCPTFVLECAQASDMGMRRLNNQDAIAVRVAEDKATWVGRGHLFLVADGMGAHAAGELASKLAVDNIPHTYHKLRDLAPPAALRQAVRDANTVIHTKGQSSIGFQGMGTTCSCLVLLPQGALVAHIGDSRVYRLRGNMLEQLTFDHSLVWEMAAAGQMAQEDVPAYIPKNVITRSLGPHPSINLDLEGPYHAAAGDTFLLCSDGLSGQVTDEELGVILQCLPPQEAVKTLIDLANLRGGPDNISIIIAQVVSNGSPQPDVADPVPNGGAKPGGWLSSLPLVALGVCAMLLAVSLWTHYWPGALASGVGVVMSLLASFAGRGHIAGVCPPIRPIGGPYGNGPYRKSQCEPTRQVVDSLAEIAGKLRSLPSHGNGEWKVDWQPFEATLKQAEVAATASDFRAAVRHYSQAIHGVMQQLRDHRPPTSDTQSFDPPPC